MTYMDPASAQGCRRVVENPVAYIYPAFLKSLLHMALALMESARLRLIR